jgi:hypothetical protein
LICDSFDGAKEPTHGHVAKLRHELFVRAEVLQQGGTRPRLGMARLIVEARTAEWTSGDVVYTLLLGVSVSRADNGSPVTGLKDKNFRISPDVDRGDMGIYGAYELGMGTARHGTFGLLQRQHL